MTNWLPRRRNAALFSLKNEYYGGKRSPYSPILLYAMMKEVNPFYEGVIRQATLPHRTAMICLRASMIGCGVENVYRLRFQSPGLVLVVLSFISLRPAGDT